ncbi:hypothetical protein LZ575_16305 [Antarcticibacterium sp. 1MA-6-2]|uniref:hypothetical protein n=1 Tax=Antarcticibacterium sp. 1MA-6-2 TaxID=2908210 RepID=UPI001F1FBB27|nr:hypothetical protein [Antarcticibacterium sp. 1MA-6-2]UJH90384.1 hypothetical protein LZ575_16305 [Antarcticibacterium sp. 1MA-6-2]
MDATELRVQLLEKIKNADDEQLNIIKNILDNIEQERSGTYNVQGKILSQEDFKREIAKAEDEYEKGNFTTHTKIKEDPKSRLIEIMRADEDSGLYDS